MTDKAHCFCGAMDTFWRKGWSSGNLHLTEPLLSHTTHRPWSPLHGHGGRFRASVSESFSLWVFADFPQSCSFPIPPPSMEVVKFQCALPSLFIKFCPCPLLLIVVSGVPWTGHDPLIFVFPFSPFLYLSYFFPLTNPTANLNGTIPHLHPHHTRWPHLPPGHC